jgi:HlyD family secretion protein
VQKRARFLCHSLPVDDIRCPNVAEARRSHVIDRKKKIVAALLLAAVLLWRNHDSPAAVAQYVTVPIEAGELRRIVTATGTLDATLNVEVGSQLSGQIAELLVDFNDDVKKGQPLARLDQRTFLARVAEGRATVEMAEAAIAVARAKLERARTDALDSEAQRAVLEAPIENARVKLQAARNELKRKETLRDRQISPAVAVEDAQTKVSTAEAALREAAAIVGAHENKIAGARADLQRAEAELASAIATLPQKQAELEIAEIDLDRATIRSPIDGVVVGRKVNQGQTLATTLEAKTLFVIAGDLRQMDIDAKLDEADIGKIQVGQDAIFTVDAYPGREYAARVRQVRKSAEVQQNVVTYTVVLSAANPDNLLLPGMTAVTRITVSRTGPITQIPLAALRYRPKPEQAGPAAPPEASRGRPASVWVLGENGEPKAVSVGIGEDDASHAAILSGPLKPGDRVIVADAANPAPRGLFGLRVGF